MARDSRLKSNVLRNLPRSRQREAGRDDLQRQRVRIREDLNYLKRHKVALLRAGTYEPEEFRQDVQRLEDEFEVVGRDLAGHQPSRDEILECLISISELLKNAKLWYKMALDVEKHKIVTTVVMGFAQDCGNGCSASCSTGCVAGSAAGMAPGMGFAQDCDDGCVAACLSGCANGPASAMITVGGGSPQVPGRNHDALRRLISALLLAG